MAEDQRRCPSGKDHISGLPDELLHCILIHLGSARAAACTSMLSRRWRDVWRHLPELHLDEDGTDDAPPPHGSFMDTVDAALGAYLAPTLDRLSVSLSTARHALIPASRVAPWLRFASERAVGCLFVDVPPGTWPPLHTPNDGDGSGEEDAVLELPTCPGAKSITLSLAQPWILRLPPPAGLFAALTSLTIYYGRMEGIEITALVCTRCPRLETLTLIVTMVAESDITIRSDSMRSLQLWVNNIRRLEVVAPTLDLISLSDTMEACISAPKLAEVYWRSDAYDPGRHQFVDAGRRLRQLEIWCSRPAALMRRFDEVDVLRLNINIPKGITGYESFLNETNELPKCKTLSISLSNEHCLTPAVLHLLRSCSSTRKLSVQLHSSGKSLGSPCPSSCPCGFEESRRIDGISLNSLEDVKINSYTSSLHEKLEFVEHLCRCNAPILKRLVIEYTMFSDPQPSAMETFEKIRNMCHPNIEVQFYVFSSKGLVLLE